MVFQSLRILVYRNNISVLRIAYLKFKLGTSLAVVAQGLCSEISPAVLGMLPPTKRTLSERV